MKKVVLIGTVAVSCAINGMAYGADYRSPAPAAPPAPAFTWTGFYFGVHVGHGWKKSEATAITGNVNFPVGFEFDRIDAAGFLAGGQIGFDYQVGRWVFGVEGTYSAADIEGSTTDASPIIPSRFSSTELREKWLATVAARLGYAWENVLFYLKGGAAWSRFESHSNLFSVINPSIAITVGDDTRAGWLVGWGFEWAAPAFPISFKVETNYIDYGTKTVSRTVLTGPTAGAVLLREVDASELITMFGVNYRFGYVSPVTARY